MVKAKQSTPITPGKHHQRAKVAYDDGADGMPLFNLSHQSVLKAIGMLEKKCRSATGSASGFA